jgi:hypothetical protein
METDKKSWPAVIIRIFAAINLLMGLVGLVALWASVRTTLKFDPWSQDPPFYAQAYYTRSGINVVFVVLTILGGLYLWRLGRRGWTVCKVLFIAQIVYFFIGWFDFLLPLAMGDRASAVSRAFGACRGTGDMGTNLQVITGYPVIALIGLKIAYGRLLRGTTSAPGATTPSSPTG